MGIQLNAESVGRINMKANEFIKKFGLDSFKAAMLCPQFRRYNYAILYFDEVDFSNDFIDKHADYMFKTADIKRLIDSHELVEKLGGLENAKDEYFSCVQNNEPASYVAKAIADVESCNE